jgi:hypothetical protein
MGGFLGGFLDGFGGGASVGRPEGSCPKQGVKSAKLKTRIDANLASSDFSKNIVLTSVRHYSAPRNSNKESVFLRG